MRAPVQYATSEIDDLDISSVQSQMWDWARGWVCVQNSLKIEFSYLTRSCSTSRLQSGCAWAMHLTSAESRMIFAKLTFWTGKLHHEREICVVERKMIPTYANRASCGGTWSVSATLLGSESTKEARKMDCRSFQVLNGASSYRGFFCYGPWWGAYSERINLSLTLGAFCCQTKDKQSRLHPQGRQSVWIEWWVGKVCGSCHTS